MMMMMTMMVMVMVMVMTFFVKETTLMMLFANIIYYMMDDMIRSDKV